VHAPNGIGQTLSAFKKTQGCLDGILASPSSDESKTAGSIGHRKIAGELKEKRVGQTI
jgi:hypothetical protein